MQSGDVIWNPLTGEKVLFVQTAEETGGARIVVDFAVEAGGFVPGGEHVHDHCTEHFDVRAGTIAFVIDGEERTLGSGDSLTVVPGQWHHWWNGGDGEVQIRTRIEPAAHFQEALLVFWGLCADGHTDAQGRPSPLLGALAGTRFRYEMRYRRPPDALQRLAFPALAALARHRGLERAIDRYLDLEKHPSAEAGLGRLPERIMAAAA
jgi:mannose-6-phosphate isomerase-like protein (cupin superfamily)